MADRRNFSVPTREHGLKNPRFYKVVEEGDKKLVMRQLKKNELPEGLVYVDGWLNEGLSYTGRVAEVAGTEGVWGYVFGDGIGNRDIIECFPDDWEITIL